MNYPNYDELPPQLKQILDPSKPKNIAMVARGVAPLPPATLISAWCYLERSGEPEMLAAAKKSLDEYPDKMMLPVLQTELPSWVLYHLGLRFLIKDEFLEFILLNDFSPDEIFLEAAAVCSEKMTILISNNQERIIQSPELVKILEKNPQNLKSNTDRLKHFLHLAGIQIPGEQMAVGDAPTPAMKAAIETATSENEAESESTEDADAADLKKISEIGTALNEEQKQSLLQFISKLNIGGRMKIAMKGNKEVRQILIRDSNKIVSMAVLKSPRITDNEICHYSALRNVSDDVIRAIGGNPTWSKVYQVKYNLCFHPKTPLQQSMVFLKFLNMRDLGKLAKERNIPGPLRKAAKELLAVKRK
ncbi:MAG: hypothetical protein J0L93_01740 [Deltaproteobacteria bacterium]|nr:hypothetical protein [Deltaproteobacteria bacterium]